MQAVPLTGAPGKVPALRPALLSPPAAAAARRRPLLAPRSSGAAGSVPAPDSSNGAPSPPPEAAASSSNGAGPGAAGQAGGGGGPLAWLRQQAAQSAELRKKLASYGLAAVLSYGIFDGVSYTIAFSLAFLGYEARTGLNPTANVADIVKICILMWAGNNVTRPFRLAGAAALAPFMDTVIDRLQAKLRLRSKTAAFAILVALVAGVCFAILGALFFSRWIQG